MTIAGDFNARVDKQPVQGVFGSFGEVININEDPRRHLINFYYLKITKTFFIKKYSQV